MEIDYKTNSAGSKSGYICFGIILAIAIIFGLLLVGSAFDYVRIGFPESQNETNTSEESPYFDNISATETYSHFGSADEVINYQRQLQELWRVDSIFVSMPVPALRTVIDNIGFNRSISELVYEYESRPSYYNTNKIAKQVHNPVSNRNKTPVPTKNPVKDSVVSPLPPDTVLIQ